MLLDKPSLTFTETQVVSQIHTFFTLMQNFWRRFYSHKVLIVDKISFQEGVLDLDLCQDFFLETYEHLSSSHYYDTRQDGNKQCWSSLVTISITFWGTKTVRVKYFLPSLNSSKSQIYFVCMRSCVCSSRGHILSSQTQADMDSFNLHKMSYFKRKRTNEWIFLFW